MDNCGKHILLDMYWNEGEDISQLQKTDIGYNRMKKAIEAANATIVKEEVHHFGGKGGYTCLFLLAESHASIHTFPEIRQACVDFYFCGNCNPWDAIKIITKTFNPSLSTTQYYTRGYTMPYVVVTDPGIRTSFT